MNFLLDNWILLTFENGESYKNVCDSSARTASIMLVCGSNKVRKKKKLDQPSKKQIE
jgi:hypothetical protein